MIVQPPFVLADTSDRCIEGLFGFSGVFGISVPDNRRELLIIGPGHLEIQLLSFLYLRIQRHISGQNSESFF
jgi:hypothetical protein